MEGGVRVYIGFGSNVGDGFGFWREVLERLGGVDGFRLEGVSSLYWSEPVGGPVQPRYLNGVIGGIAELPPRRLLRELLELERSLGRERSVRWGPRTVDLDLLLYGELVGSWGGEPELTLPHPRLHLRRFVLVPLLELAGDLEHPKFRRPLSAFLEELDPLEQRVERVGEND